MSNPIDQFHQAFFKNDATAIRAFFQAHPELKARINDPVAAFDSPIINSVRSREMLDVILEAGADINARSRWWAGGFGFLDVAKPELAEYAIKRGARLDAHSAARLGKLDALREFITADPSLVNAPGGDGQTPLHFASTIAIADFLLTHGADINARDVDHESTPAQYMVKSRKDVASHLVGCGCATDILMAAALGNFELVRQHVATTPSVIRMNVSETWFPKKDPRAGGTIYTWTIGANKTALAVARELGHQEILAWLLSQSPAELKFAEACATADEATARELLASRPDILQTLTPEDRAVFANAVRDSNRPAVRLMLSLGWPLDALGQHEATALHWAAFHGDAETAELLLRHNPPLELKDKDFSGTPLGWAIHGSEHGWHSKTGNYAGVVEALLRAGAKPPAEPGGTPAVRAVLERHASR